MTVALTPKEQLFVDAYLGVSAGNGTDACRRAGYKGDAKVLSVQASRMLGKASVKLAIAAAREQSHAAAIMTAEEVAIRLSGIAMGMVTEKRVVGGANDFVEVELPAMCGTQIDAMKVLAKVRGYEAPSKTEVTGVLGVAQLTPEQDAALATWLRWRNDPVIAARIAELEAE